MSAFTGKAEKSQKSASLRADAALLLWWAPMLLAGVYVALTPYADVLASLRLYDIKRLLQVGLLLAEAVCVAAVPPLRSGWLKAFRRLPEVARWGLGAVLALGVAAALTAPVPRYGLLDVAHYALLFNLALAAASLCRAFPRRFVQVLCGALGISALLYVVYFGVGYTTHLSGGMAGLWPGGDIGFANKRFFNQFQSWSLPLLALPVMMHSVRRTSGAQTLAFALLACWWMLAFASGGRGILLGMGIALAGTGILFKEKAWPWVRVQLVAGGIGALLYGLLFQVIAPAQHSIVERAQTKGIRSGGRLEDWQNAGEAITQQPWLGIGPLHTAYFPNGLWPTPHNAAVQFVTEWGLPAFLMLAGLALWGLWAWSRQTRQFLSGANKNDTKDATLFALARVAVTGSLLAAGTHAMVSGVVVMPASQVMMALVTGAALGLYLKRRSSSAVSSTSRGKERWLLAVFLIGASGIVVWAISPDVLQLNVRVAEAVFESGTLRLPPRYWSYGFFGL